MPSHSYDQTGVRMCATPGCTLADKHADPCTTSAPLKRRCNDFQLGRDTVILDVVTVDRFTPIPFYISLP